MYPLGCLPIGPTLVASRDKADYDRHGCLRSVNSWCHDTTTLSSANRLRCFGTSTRRQRSSLLSTTDPSLHFYIKPGHFGLNSSTALLTCCGAGGPPYNYNFSTQCGQPGVMACAHPSEALQWDGFHLTEAAYRLIADGWLHGPYADPPILLVAH